MPPVEARTIYDWSANKNAVGLYSKWTEEGSKIYKNASGTIFDRSGFFKNTYTPRAGSAGKTAAKTITRTRWGRILAIPTFLAGAYVYSNGV